MNNTGIISKTNLKISKGIRYNLFETNQDSATKNRLVIIIAITTPAKPSAFIRKYKHIIFTTTERKKVTDKYLVFSNNFGPMSTVSLIIYREKNNDNPPTYFEAE